MLSFLQFAITEGSLVYRLDHKTIPDFNKHLKSYEHSPDWVQSGRVSSRHVPAPGMTKSKGLFAGQKHDVAPYSSPRNVRWVQHHDAGGQSHITFHKNDETVIRAHRPVLSSFSKQHFDKQANDEHFSIHPGKPVHQRVITDPVKFMQRNGHKVHFTNDLDSHYKKVQSSKHPWGAEGF